MRVVGFLTIICVYGVFVAVGYMNSPDITFRSAKKAILRAHHYSGKPITEHLPAMDQIIHDSKRQITCNAGRSCDTNSDCFGGIYTCCEDPDPNNPNNEKCFRKKFSIPLDGTCLFEDDGAFIDECINECEEKPFLQRSLQCVEQDKNNDGIGSCWYGYPEGCPCIDATDCESVAGACVGGTCVKLRSTDEDCSADADCWSDNCQATKCVGIPLGQSCAVKDYDGANPCAIGTFCAPNDFFSKTDFNGTCTANAGENQPCGLVEFTHNGCGPGLVCDVPTLGSLNQLLSACVQNSSFVDCGTCKPIFAGERSSDCNTPATCRPELDCDAGTNKCITRVDDVPCSNKFLPCQIGHRCQCNFGNPRCEVGDTVVPKSLQTQQCLDAFVNYHSTCARANECAGYGNFEGSCMREHCMDEFLAMVCECTDNGNAPALPLPCGVKCNPNSFTETAPCCTGRECVRDDFEDVDDYPDTQCGCFTDFPFCKGAAGTLKSYLFSVMQHFFT
eukprot:TRINITY_DN5210_c0_g1_i1.p1 TRINITY_DN5210_c0_g1~~TRINITY_DN5210_c0_g1_i1.p1  ORF type:complete len:503 (-),score=62.19 TRINITY_DN5210_c0_g1_i1:23-1531(-)